MRKPLWPRIRRIRKRIWNATSATYSAVSTTRASSSGRWVTKPDTVRISKLPTTGSRPKTRAVPYSTNRPIMTARPIFTVRCMPIMKVVLNIAKTTASRSRSSSANTHMPWVTHRVVSRNTGTLSASIRNTRADLSGTSSTSRAAGPARTVR